MASSVGEWVTGGVVEGLIMVLVVLIGLLSAGLVSWVRRFSFGEIKIALITGGGSGVKLSNTGRGLVSGKVPTGFTAGVNRGVTNSVPRKLRKVST